MIDKLSHFVRMKRGDMSLRDFAKMCGDISHTQIDSIERGVDPRTGKPVRPTVETLAKIAKGTGVTVAYLAALANGDDISQLPGYLGPVVENKKIPIIGSVKCGPDGLAFEYIDGCVSIDDSYNGNIIAFRCKGDSMKDMGIEEGDIAIVRQQDDVESGEVAVVIVNGDEGTLKRVRKFEDGSVMLLPANSHYEPRVFAGEQLNTVKIVGKVLEVRKKL